MESKATSYLEINDTSFSRGLTWSIFLHLGFVAFVVGKALFFPDTVLKYTPSLRVDVVDLPDLIKKDLIKVGIPKPPPPAEEIKNETSKTKVNEAKPDEMVLSKKKKTKEKSKSDSKKSEAKRENKMANALARIKALNKIKEGEEHVIKGNKISAGTTTTGDAKERTETTYYDEIYQHIRAKWELPIWLERQGHSAQVKVFIDARGQLKGLRIMKTSGSARFVQEVKRAIENSLPFPAPPSDFRSTVLLEGILLGFPL